MAAKEVLEALPGDSGDLSPSVALCTANRLSLQ
jgi:hypothetical protein